jgi:flagellar basal-body rod modification protein FlgD
MVAATQSSDPSAALIASLNAANSSLAKSSSGNAGSVSSIQDNFLKMLTAQLQNQDPLNPMDNAQITSQMAQLSTVSGINQLNTTLQALNDSVTMGQAMSATSMIGHGVLVAGASLALSSGQAVGGVDLSQPADDVVVTIKDAAGNVVRTLDLGAQQAGTLPFAWDGQTDTGTTAADGTYTFSAQAVLSGVATDAATLSFGLVNAVTPGVNGATLDVGQLGGFALSAVKQII